MNRMITYSPSTTIALTHACANRCLYCGFREEEAGLLQFEEIKKIAMQAKKEGDAEILLISGEKADQIPSVRNALRSMGFNSMVDWTKKVCDYLLELDLLPHINIGILDYAGLQDLKEVSASMGLMMEGDYPGLGLTVHPEKNFSARLQTLEWAGQLRIPFTTGILMGLGETQEDRLRSMEAIIGSCRTHGHVQEIILQNYVPNRRSSIPPKEISTEELKEIIDLSKEKISEVHLQIPVNLNSHWDTLLVLGFDDLGGISRNTDLVNEGNPWPPMERIRAILKDKRYRLRKRLPIYPSYYQRGWYSTKVGSVIEKWISSDNEYRYYAQ